MNIYAKASIFWTVGTLVLLFTRLRMLRDKTDKEKEPEVIWFGVALCCGVLIINMMSNYAPVMITDQIVVFETFSSLEKTVVMTNGTGKYIFLGLYNFTEGATYNVTWKFPRLKIGGQYRYGENVVLVNMTLIEATTP